MQQRRIVSFVLYSLAAACAAAWAVFFLRALLPATLPFWLGLLIAALLRPATLFLSRILKLRRRRAAIAVTTLFFSLLGLLLGLLLALLWGQCCSVAARLPSLYKTTVVPAMAAFFEWLSKFLSRFAPDLTDAVQLWMQSSAAASSKLFSALSSWLLGVCTDLAGKIPVWFVTVIVTVLCAGFISLDYPKVIRLLCLPLPQKLQDGLVQLKRFAASTVLRLMRAYLILLLLTFLELCLGLWVLRVKSFVALAALIALLDLLPIIGTGSVLIPWAILSFLNGQANLGWGLIVLYLAITVARNLLEPKLVGKSIGLPPLVSLVCLYAGLRLFGVVGAILLPCIATGAVFFLKSKKEGNAAE